MLAIISDVLFVFNEDYHYNLQIFEKNSNILNGMFDWWTIFFIIISHRRCNQTWEAPALIIYELYCNTGELIRSSLNGNMSGVVCLTVVCLERRRIPSSILLFCSIIFNLNK